MMRASQVCVVVRVVLSCVVVRGLMCQRASEAWPRDACSLRQPPRAPRAQSPPKLTVAPPPEEVLLALGCDADKVAGSVCRQCPEVTEHGASGEAGEWSISEMRVGRFMSGDRGTLLVVQFEGCHDAGGEGALLRKEGLGEWSVVAKSASYALGQCVTLLDAQKIEQIVCPREVMEQGYMKGALVQMVPSVGGEFEERGAHGVQRE